MNIDSGVTLKVLDKSAIVLEWNISLKEENINTNVTKEQRHPYATCLVNQKNTLRFRSDGARSIEAGAGIAQDILGVSGRVGVSK